MLPAAYTVGLTLAKRYKSTFSIQILKKNLYFPAGLNLIGTVKFTRIYHTFTFQSNFNYHIVAYLRNYLAFQNSTGQTKINLRFQHLFKIFTVLICKHLINLLVKFFFR